jgi:hypothetical protein
MAAALGGRPELVLRSGASMRQKLASGLAGDLLVFRFRTAAAVQKIQDQDPESSLSR